MDGRGESSSANLGRVTCATWIRRPENRHVAIYGRSRSFSSPPLLEIFSFDANTSSISSEPIVRYVMGEEEGDPLGFAVHPSGDEILCSTANGCRLFELNTQDFDFKLLAKDLPLLQSIGPQKCLAFSTDGSKFATGGEDGHLRILKWPSLHVLLDEPRAHKSFRDMDISLDSEFLASTSADGSARIWKIDDGIPLVSLTRNSVQMRSLNVVGFPEMGQSLSYFALFKKVVKCTWNRLGHKRLLTKPISVLSVSLDGKYLAVGSNDGDMCVVEVKKMEISHWSKKLHLGTQISSIEFCPSESYAKVFHCDCVTSVSLLKELGFHSTVAVVGSCSVLLLAAGNQANPNGYPSYVASTTFGKGAGKVVISISHQWGAVVTKLNVPADWKVWQIYMVLLGLFLASAIVFYIFYENSDSFWNFPLGRDQPARPFLKSFVSDSQLGDDQSPW